MTKPIEKSAATSKGTDGASAIEAQAKATAGCEYLSSVRVPIRELRYPATGEDRIAPTVVQASAKPSLPFER